jgi:hypothetical protein
VKTKKKKKEKRMNKGGTKYLLQVTNERQKRCGRKKWIKGKKKKHGCDMINVTSHRQWAEKRACDVAFC